jgi:hypothetical protein
MSWMEKLKQAQGTMLECPWSRTVGRCVPANVEGMSTVALLDLLGVPPSTANARKLAGAMRSLGWVAIKSRRLMPGGFRDTTIRGWARPVRLSASRSLRKGEKVGSRRLNTAMPAGPGETEGCVS